MAGRLFLAATFAVGAMASKDGRKSLLAPRCSPVSRPRRDPARSSLQGKCQV
jgi:hypothetical protein